MKFLTYLLLASSILPVSLLPIYGQKSSTPVTKSWDAYSGNREKSPYRGLQWELAGPVMNSGRVESLAVHPEKPGTIYAGFGSGNLWKTTNHGFSWEPIFDNHPGYSIGDICLAPSNPEIVYLATGENLRALRGHTIPGAGVYRSDDGGKTWRSLGLEDTYHIGRVAVHPKNPDIVFVAALGHFYSQNIDRGLFKSTNGGRTWKKVLYLNDKTGANDVIFAPGNPEILYSSTWQCGGSMGGPGGKIFKSTDGGDSWLEITNGFPKGPMNGRTGLAVSYQNPDKIYALTDNLNRQYDEGTAELYISTDGGASWSKTHEGGLKIFSSFGNVFTDCYTNPLNDSEVYLLGISVLRSDDAGKTFNQLRGDIHNIVPSPADFFHVDHHDMWINPENPDHIIVGNDGGLYISYDKALSWFRYNNIPVGEFYFVRTDNENPYNIYGGTQDNSAVMGPSHPLKRNAPDGWRYVWIDPWSGGDGIVTAPDPKYPNTVYYESQNGHLNRKEMTTGETVFIKPSLPDSIGDDFFTEWLTPYFISEYNHTTLYYGANYLFKSADRGDSWRVISPNLSESANAGRRGGGLTSISESPKKKGLLYAGTSMGALWISHNDGGTWTEISTGLPARYVKSITPSGFSESGVYLTMSGIREDDFQPVVFQSDDYGTIWSDISSGMPESPVNVILEDQVHQNVLYAGTFNGILISDNRGQTWHVLGSGVPNSFVADMTIMKREKDLIAATHGRGIYKLDLEPVHAYLSLGAGIPAILHITPATLPLSDASGRKHDMSTLFDLIVTFCTPETLELTIEISDSSGNTVYRDKMKAGKGLNSWRWDLITGRTDDDSPYFYSPVTFPDPGEYKVKMSGKSVSMEKLFTIK
jgi:photosystem II stability/assembly factor-like uncharacterized protein